MGKNLQHTRKFFLTGNEPTKTLKLFLYPSLTELTEI